MEFETSEVLCDFVVVGGGFSGICAAVEAARSGLKTALVSNRAFIGGNSGAEVRCPVDGADGEQQYNFNARETGLIEEIRLENLRVNPAGNSYRWDAVLMDIIGREANLELYLNTAVDRVDTDGGHIVSVSGVQFTAEKRYVFRAKLFADNTGDGTVAHLAGCAERTGAEAASEYGEKIAPGKECGDRLLSTLTFFTKDTGRPVPYAAPDGSVDVEALHLLDHREIPKEMFSRFVWFYETGAHMDEIADAEKTAMEHRRLVYGIWDYIKKHPEYGAENYDFEYIAPYPGKRETRRIKGLYTLTERDVVQQTEFPDAVGYGGWAIDLHSAEGFYGKDPENWWVYLDGIYQIPLRCAIAADADNLFLVGRCFSATHVALGSARVNATLATVGQAVGLAAGLCVRGNILPWQIVPDRLEELHRLQYRRDQAVPGYRNDDPKDLALRASVKASSVCRYGQTEPTDWFALDEVVAVSLPVKPELKTMRFLFRADSGADVEYRIFRPSKPQNYGPGTLLGRGAFFVGGAGEEQWCELDLRGLKLSREFLFIEFEGTKEVQIGTSTERLPGVVSAVRRGNSLPNVRDYETLQMLPYEWNRLGMPNKLRKYSTAPMKNIFYTPCFTTAPELDMYSPAQAVNGYARPFGSPNLWVSASAKGEYLELTLTEPADIREIAVTFDSNLNFRIRNIKPYDFSAMPEVVKSFDVSFMAEDGVWTKTAQVRGNCQRFCVIGCDLHGARRVRLDFLGTNGCGRIGVYSVSLY